MITLLRFNLAKLPSIFFSCLLLLRHIFSRYSNEDEGVGPLPGWTLGSAPLHLSSPSPSHRRTPTPTWSQGKDCSAFCRNRAGGGWRSQRPDRSILYSARINTLGIKSASGRSTLPGDHLRTVRNPPLCLQTYGSSLHRLSVFPGRNMTSILTTGMAHLNHRVPVVTYILRFIFRQKKLKGAQDLISQRDKCRISSYQQADRTPSGS